MQSFLRQPQRVLLRAPTAKTDECVELMTLVIFYDCFGHISHAAIYFHAMRFVTAGTKDRATYGENSGKGIFFQPHAVVLSQTAKAVAESDKLHRVKSERGFANTSNRSIEPWAVAAGSQNSNAFGFTHDTLFYKRFSMDSGATMAAPF